MSAKKLAIARKAVFRVRPWNQPRGATPFIDSCAAAALALRSAQRRVRRADQGVDDAGLGGGVTGVPDDLESGARPGLLQRPRALQRRHHVEAALHDPTR